MLSYLTTRMLPGDRIAQVIAGVFCLFTRSEGPFEGCLRGWHWSGGWWLSVLCGRPAVDIVRPAPGQELAPRAVRTRGTQSFDPRSSRFDPFARFL